MVHEGLHETEDDLSEETRDMHRALTSLREEFEAVDWYRQRADACLDSQLKAILMHNMREEMEHSAMLIEWLRCNDDAFDKHLRSHVSTGSSSTGAEDTAAETPPVIASRSVSIGALKE